jgi:hypothetical protein
MVNRAMASGASQCGIGAACHQTYTGDRNRFANRGAPIQLHPEFNQARYQSNDLTWEASGCALLVVIRAKINKLRRCLARQAKRLERAQSKSTVRAA